MYNVSNTTGQNKSLAKSLLIIHFFKSLFPKHLTKRKNSAETGKWMIREN